MPKKSFKDLSEREILALAISLEEEDIRTYSDLAEAMHENYPGTARMFAAMAEEENGHRHRLLDLYRTKFGDHIPLIRRQDVKGFLERKSFWLLRPLGLEKVRAQVELMEAESKRFYQTAARHSTDAAIRQLLDDLAAEERRHEARAEELESDQTGKGAASFLRDAGTRMSGEAAHVHFVYDGPRRGPVERRVAFPIVRTRIRHHALHCRRGIVAFLSRSFATVVFRNNRGACVWIKEDFGGIEAHSTRRIVWPVDSIAVDLTRFDAGCEHMPVVIRTVR